MTLLLWPFLVAIILVLVIGLYCIMATLNLVRLLIGLELMIKAVTLLLIASGYVIGHPYLTQSFVITLIVIEVVIMVVATGVVLNIYFHTGSLDARSVRELKG